jgi:MFS family permease
MKPHVVGLLRARAAAVYLLSLHSASHAVMAYEPGLLTWKELAGGAGILALALVLGVWWGPWLGALVDRSGRTRLIMVSWIPYGGMLAFSAIAVSNGDLEDIGHASRMFVVIQPLFLALAGLGRGYLGAIQNALVLTIFAAVPGGVVAGAAVCGFVGWCGAFLAFDNAARKLAAYPGVTRGATRSATLHALATVGPVVLALGVFFWSVPATPYAKLARTGVKRTVTKEQIAAAYRDLVWAMAAGGIGAWLAAWALLRTRGGESVPVLEVVEARRRGEEIVPAAPARMGAVEYSGVRGRIVRAYVRFVERLGKLGILRRPDMTPAEFASRVPSDGADLALLTDAFVRARWGGDEPTEDDARLAERAAESVVHEVRERGASPE